MLDNTLERYDLDRSDQRVDAVREALTLTRAIRDTSKIEEFLREVATKVGLDLEQVRDEHRRAKQPAVSRPTEETQPTPGSSAAANFGAPEFSDEREVLKALVQFPQVASEHAVDLTDNDFTHPIAQAVWQAMSKLGLPRAADTSWVARIEGELESDDARRILSVAAVQPLQSRTDSTDRVVAVTILQLQARTLVRHIADLKSKLQRANPAEQAEEHNQMFGELIALEQQHRSLRDRITAD